MIKRFCALSIELIAAVVVVWVVGTAVLDRVEMAFRIGNTYNAEADGSSEADALNAGMNYYLHGFLVNAGLPNRGHPINPHRLYLDPDDTPVLNIIYTHYPPGPYWLVGLSKYIFGPKQVPQYRLVPILFCAACFLGTYWLLRRSLGGLLAAGVIFVVFQIPMTTRMMHSLFFHSYSLAFLVFQISFVFVRLREPRILQLKDLLIIFVCSFLQGWMSFDYAFVASLFPLAIHAAYRTRKHFREAVRASLMAGMGFSLAHFLHILQVWSYHGSWAATYGDFFASAHHRLGGQGPKLMSLSRVELMQEYLTKFIPTFGGAGYYHWLLPTVILAVVVGARFILRVLGRRGSSPVFRPSAAFAGVAAGFVISFMWIALMKNHASESGHLIFLPRHFMLAMFTNLLCLAEMIYACGALCKASVETGRSRGEK